MEKIANFSKIPLRATWWGANSGSRNLLWEQRLCSQSKGTLPDFEVWIELIWRRKSIDASSQ